MEGTHKECSDSKHRLQMLALLLGGRKDKGGTLEAPLIGCCEQSMMEDQVSIQGASGLRAESHQTLEERPICGPREEMPAVNLLSD